jgi:hypothetical protein
MDQGGTLGLAGLNPGVDFAAVQTDICQKPVIQTIELYASPTTGHVNANTREQTRLGKICILCCRIHFLLELSGVWLQVHCTNNRDISEHKALEKKNCYIIDMHKTHI